MNYVHYSSIDNSYRTKTLDYICQLGLSGQNEIWIAQDKCDGAHFDFVISDEDFKMAKRTSFIGNDENFYGSLSVRQKYEENVKKIFEHLKKIKGSTEVYVVGEIMGGYYPGRKTEGAVRVNKKVAYCDWNDFYAYDLYVNGEFLNMDETEDLLKQFGFLYARTLVKGTLQEVLNHSPVFIDPISGWLGLPPIEGNYSEGLVIKPLITRRFPSGERIILKNKNPKFAEKEDNPKELKEVVELTDEAKKVLETLNSYITDNRLHAVISKIGKIDVKMFGKLLGLFVKDILDDYAKDTLSSQDNGTGDIVSRFKGIDATEEKRICKMLNALASVHIRCNFSNIIDNTF